MFCAKSLELSRIVYSELIGIAHLPMKSIMHLYRTTEQTNHSLFEKIRERRKGRKLQIPSLDAKKNLICWIRLHVPSNWHWKGHCMNSLWSSFCNNETHCLRLQTKNHSLHVKSFLFFSMNTSLNFSFNTEANRVQSF